MRLSLHKRLLQTAVAIGGLVPVGAGLSGLLLGPAMVAPALASPASLDSHFRYLSGLLLGIGCAYWSTIPRLEQQTARFQLLTFLVVVGGVARLVSLCTVGLPDPPMLFGLVMELIITPLLALAQFRLARRAASQA